MRIDKKQEPTLFLFARLFQYTADIRPRVYQYMTLSAFGASIWIMQPAFIAKLLNTIQAGNGVNPENMLESISEIYKNRIGYEVLESN